VARVFLITLPRPDSGAVYQEAAVYGMPGEGTRKMARNISLGVCEIMDMRAECSRDEMNL